MTEYDAFDLYARQENKDKITSIEGNNGKLIYKFADGTAEVWKRNRFGKLYRFKKRGK